MAAGQITLNYTGLSAIVLDQFTGKQLPRQIKYEANVEYTAAGLVVLDGPSQAHKRLWTISALTNKTVAINLVNLFSTWDAARANGNIAGLTITDETFGSSTGAVNVFFSSPPQPEIVGEVNTLWQVGFSLAEI